MLALPYITEELVLGGSAGLCEPDDDADDGHGDKQGPLLAALPPVAWLYIGLGTNPC